VSDVTLHLHVTTRDPLNGDDTASLRDALLTLAVEHLEMLGVVEHLVLVTVPGAQLDEVAS
jgi:hypothetical protein